MANEDDAYFDPQALAWEEEKLFSRDVYGQLIRVEPATEADYEVSVMLTIDGRSVTVSKAVPTADAQGNILNDSDGRTIPRATTIYDAARKLYGAAPDERFPIPTLCHCEHLRIAGVCRICSVAAYRSDKPEERRTLVPACHQPVAKGMIVHTALSDQPDDALAVFQTARTLTELLTSDHLRDRNAVSAARGVNELADVVGWLEAAARDFGRRFRGLVESAALPPELAVEPWRFRFSDPQPKAQDRTSDLIVVNRESCVLCNRCIRACDEVKRNDVIGRAGKGYSAKIAFDLDDRMGESSCVTCGECMFTCPTDALTMKVKPKAAARSDERLLSTWLKACRNDPNCEELTSGELRARHELFRHIPYKYLEWNIQSVVRRRVPHGTALCHQDEYGGSAFILESGHFGIYKKQPPTRPVATRRWWTRLLGAGDDKADVDQRPTRQRRSRPLSPGDDKLFHCLIGEHGPVSGDHGDLVAVRPAADIIMGEMTCMNNHPRTATVVALGECHVFEIRRNLLYILQRHPETRGMLDGVYTRHALAPDAAVWRTDLFEVLDDDEFQECLSFLSGKIKLIHADPDQVIFRQGEDVVRDGKLVGDFYIVRLGHVRITQTVYGEDLTLKHIGPNDYFGEIALLAHDEHGSFDAMVTATNAQALREISRRRSATCRALDDVELVAIPGEAFKEICTRFPPLRRELLRVAIAHLKESDRLLGHTPPAVETIGGATPRRSETVARGSALPPPLAEFLNQGLYNANQLLVLDLERCTRCDECTRACADTHDGVTRLLREGLRFDKYLIASACRSCSDPYCLVGCPVDAIHRDSTREIIIDDNCIGCGLCANNCPYGNINMVPLAPCKGPDPERPDQMIAVQRQRATTCDLCSNIVGKGSRREVSCVYACPHEAAFRMNGEELFQRVYGFDPRTADG